jgi:hypothetical protein
MPELQKAASLSGAASRIGEKTRDPSLFQPSASEVNLYQLHVEDLLSLNPHAEEDPTVTDLDNKLLLYYLFSYLPLCDVSSPPPLLYRSFLLALYLFFFSPCFSFRLFCLLGCVSVVPPPNFLSPVLEFISQGCRRHTKVSQNRS